ncbi:UPF0182 family membrane protein [Leptospirillum ferriphilum]|uniref:UPF0182 family membrane protein n=1 Tax=Leptospirillum ferriphilum TaxID=178606 RepID=UPI003EE54ECC
MSLKAPWIFLGFFTLVLFSSQDLMDLEVDYLWYRSVHHPELFWLYLFPRIVLAALSAGIFFLISLAGLFSVPPQSDMFLFQQGGTLRSIPYSTVRKVIAVFLFLVSIFIGDHFTAPEWSYRLLSAVKPVASGDTDPVFHHDVTFYLFRLPLLEDLLGLLVPSLLFAAVLSVTLGKMNNSWTLSKNVLSLSPRYRARVFPLFGLIAIALAMRVQLSRYRLLFENGDLISGPGYTIMHATMPAMLLLEILLLLVALTFFLLVRRGSPYAPFSLSLFTLVFAFFGLSVVPTLVERFVVLPDQFHYEKPYLIKNIFWTRKAYRLDRITIKHIPRLDGLTRSDIESNSATIRNIRLWDHRPLLTTVRQLQQIRTYYQFPLLAPDRYNLDGSIRQVLVAPRELSYGNLPSPNWINLHLAYTHGHGLIMTPVNRVTAEGLPVFWIKNIPPQTRENMRLEHARIYYGDQSTPYAVVNTQVGEFDYPKGSRNIYNHYAGTGGVRLKNAGRRLLYSYAFGTLKISLSNAITPDSRILYHRNIFDIVHKLAPYLTLDPDPVPIITQKGRLLWMIDAYTTSSHFPYATSLPGPQALINPFSSFNRGHYPALVTWPRQFNYIRNPVKILIDPKNGFPTFYVTDPSDPILETYRKISPSLYHPLSDMPDDIRTHLRFPPAIFSIMARINELYHMTSPHTFFNKEDLWSLPRRNDQIMSPYYSIMKLPGEKSEEYVMMLPYTPAHRQNLSAWLVGRSDGDHLGEMVAYTFAKERLIYGPDQIEARIDQRGPISKQLTLWNQMGSHVVRGTLLIIPIANTLLYVEPLYLEATSPGALPELRRVILAVGDRVVMRKTLSQALEALFEGSDEGGNTEESGPRMTGTRHEPLSVSGWVRLHQLAQDAQDAFQKSDIERFGKDVQEILKVIQGHP